MKHCDVPTAKSTLVKSVRCVTEYAIYSLV